MFSGTRVDQEGGYIFMREAIGSDEFSAETSKSPKCAPADNRWNKE